ncbi:MAG: hypothetical protein H0U46_08610 [Actinobacteria bacterium]|nr:hypothetical protein [Actinomycetota bacterium]
MNKREKKRRRQRAQLAARRRTALDAKEFPDRRAISAGVEAQGGVPVAEETFIVRVEPIRLETGEVLWFQSPHHAVAVIEALEPGWIPERLRPQLGLS